MIVELCIVVAVVIGIVGVKMVIWAIATQAATTQRYAHLDADPHIVRLSKSAAGSRREWASLFASQRARSYRSGADADDGSRGMLTGADGQAKRFPTMVGKATG
jgi:hypothetical protein